MGLFNSIKDVAQYVPFVGPLIQAERNREQQQDVLNWQKSAQQTTWDREDTSVQRRVTDLKAAGMSPVLAAGQGAQASSPIQVTAPQKQIVDPLAQASMVMSLITAKENIATQASQRKLMELQGQKAAAEGLSTLARIKLIEPEAESLMTGSVRNRSQASDAIQAARIKAHDLQIQRDTRTHSRPSGPGGIIRDLLNSGPSGVIRSATQQAIRNAQNHDYTQGGANRWPHGYHRQQFRDDSLQDYYRDASGVLRHRRTHQKHHWYNRR